MNAKLLRNVFLLKAFFFKSQAKLVEEALDSNMALLESFCLELESIRTNGTLCLETLYPELQLKAQEMKKLYERIDFLETVVNRVKKTVNLMEVEVDKAEKCLDSSPSVKKFLSSIFKSPQVTSYQQIEAFNPPEVFRTEDLFHEQHDDAHEVQESSRFD